MLPIEQSLRAALTRLRQSGFDPRFRRKTRDIHTRWGRWSAVAAQDIALVRANIGMSADILCDSGWIR
jgi:hypothetical protein